MNRPSSRAIYSYEYIVNVARGPILGQGFHRVRAARIALSDAQEPISGVYR
jgi:hypothetical protein